MHRVVTDKNGRMRTEDVAPPPTPEALEKLRREVRDMVAGNVQFHDDPRAAPKPVDEPLPLIYDEESWCAFGLDTRVLRTHGDWAMAVFNRFKGSDDA